MSSSRLQQQFIRLWQCCDGKSQETTLNELAEMLSCSRRHMRTLLNMMESRGWLTWEAEAGRGKRSRLTFLYTGLALQQQRAEDLLEQDRIDQLVQLVGDKAAVRQMLVSHLGRSFRQGRHILRVLYYRPMKNLLPGSALRRSETHIARQIFSALTRVNEENGELEADIAHHWQQLSPTHWRFFLRPGIHFHHGRELEMADVIASLQRSNALPLYSHIERIESPTAWTLDIHLRQPDRWLPWLLGQVPAMVLPQEWHTMNHFSSMPVGTGPYAVVRNNQNQLKIHAFEDYFGYRALIDEVNVWVLPPYSTVNFSAPPDISISTPSIEPRIIMLAMWPSRPPMPFSMVVIILSAGMPVANATSRLTIRSATKGCAFALITNRSNSTTLANAISNSADVDIGLPRVLTGVQRVIFLENGVYFFR